ncbi:PQ-loop-domain-containing protein, partial [Rhizodiscina lignyota]
LPDHCTPTNHFLTQFSRTFHTCVPTPLAFISTLLGCLSIASWLFAQMPQIYKNWRLHSTSGLSIFFLVEWLLGDASNLLGCIFTEQATWQVVLACYYCFVDIMLVAQWLWYERLRHGRPPPIQRTPSKPIQSTSMGMFRMPRFSFSPSSFRRNGDDDNGDTSPPADTPNNRTITRLGPATNSAGLGVSPRTVLYISMVLAVLSHTTAASPMRESRAPIVVLVVSESPIQIAGRLLSWISTFAYLISRLPQLYKNFRRKSTSGLSPHLFVAAFFGNLFYSTSILTNPSAWSNFPPYGGHGWAGPEGSDQATWVSKAVPFWLGAAGVLIMDAAIGVQFLVYGDGGVSAKPEIVVEEFVEPQPGEGDGMERSTQSIVIKRPWRRVNGWMRGWVP